MQVKRMGREGETYKRAAGAELGRRNNHPHPTEGSNVGKSMRNPTDAPNKLSGAHCQRSKRLVGHPMTMGCRGMERVRGTDKSMRQEHARVEAPTRVQGEDRHNRTKTKARGSTLCTHNQDVAQPCVMRAFGAKRPRGPFAGHLAVAGQMQAIAFPVRPTARLRIAVAATPARPPFGSPLCMLFVVDSSPSVPISCPPSMPSSPLLPSADIHTSSTIDCLEADLKSAAKGRPPSSSNRGVNCARGTCEVVLENHATFPPPPASLISILARRPSLCMVPEFAWNYKFDRRRALPCIAWQV